MDEFEVARVFGEKTFRSGKDYFEEGRVLSAIKLENRVLGEVLGTEKYLTQITMDGLRSSCTCPVRVNCKHGAALILQFLNGTYVDGDRIIHDLERAEKIELIKTLKNLIEENPTLLLSIQETRKEPSDKLEASVEKQIIKMLKNVIDSGYADEDFAKTFAKLVKTNSTLISKELIFYILEFLISNSERYGYFYNDYSDYTFGEDIFENLCDAFAQKSLETKDFQQLMRIHEEDNYDLFYPFLTRMVTAENASKLLAFKDRIKALLGDDSLYVEFLINARENEEAKKLLQGIGSLNESKCFNLYLRLDKTEALELAKNRKYYSSLIRYYHQINAKEEVIEFFSRALNEGITLESSSELPGIIFTAIQNVKPLNRAELLGRLFDICYKTNYYALCVDIGIELKNTGMLHRLLEKKTDFWFTPASKLKLLKFLSFHEPENAKKGLEVFAEDLIKEKKDFAYENAVKCILDLKELMNKDEWIEYLKELYKMHFRKTNLWKKIKAEGIKVKKEGNILNIS
ncbi:hypothetical protein A3K69_01580 [Candidatus Bathyarchaeota archaeon RBG_16_57_9]|nr:MAG: hypothetical protein A3K69_01580 [Candidatus Bathyarchaeota archaeon RBG_16_57_9]